MPSSLAPVRRLVRRLSDGKVLPVVDEQDAEICVEELFEYADGGPSPRPLRLWHPMVHYEHVLNHSPYAQLGIESGKWRNS